MTFREGWNLLSEEERAQIMEMPNFDWEIFSYFMENEIKMDVDKFKNLIK